MLSIHPHAQLRSPEGMALARARLQQCGWFIHATKAEFIREISQQGLQPRRQSPAMGAHSDPIFGELNIEREILCLRPLKAVLKPGIEDRSYTLAVNATHLPARIGVDWSYDPCWVKLIEFAENCEPAEALYKVGLKYGSIVTYDHIPAEHLRIWSEGAPNDDPAQWLKLCEAEL